MVHYRKVVGIIYALIGVLVIGMAVAYADSYPTPSQSWLTKPGSGSHDETIEHYTAINASST